MIEQKMFRAAMARLGAAVNLITTDGTGGRHGLTASAVCSVTDDPPTLLVCINRASAANARLKANGVLCVNILAGRHQSLSNRFAGGAAGVERFLEEDGWIRLRTGSPVLADASVALDCRIVSVNEVGTHSVFFAEVEEMAMHAQAEGLIYFNRAYHHLGTEAAIAGPGAMR